MYLEVDVVLVVLVGNANLVVVVVTLLPDLVVGLVISTVLLERKAKGGDEGVEILYTISRFPLAHPALSSPFGLGIVVGLSRRAVSGHNATCKNHNILRVQYFRNSSANKEARNLPELTQEGDSDSCARHGGLVVWLESAEKTLNSWNKEVFSMAIVLYWSSLEFRCDNQLYVSRKSKGWWRTFENFLVTE